MIRLETDLFIQQTPGNHDASPHRYRFRGHRLPPKYRVLRKFAFKVSVLTTFSVESSFPSDTSADIQRQPFEGPCIMPSWHQNVSGRALSAKCASEEGGRGNLTKPLQMFTAAAEKRRRGLGTECLLCLPSSLPACLPISYPLHPRPDPTQFMRYSTAPPPRLATIQRPQSTHSVCPVDGLTVRGMNGLLLCWKVMPSRK